MLLPALGKARATAQSIACTSNLKQIHLATFHYINDTSWCLPAFTSGRTARSRLDESGYLKLGNVWKCPSEITGRWNPSSDPHLGINASTFGLAAHNTGKDNARMQTPPVRFSAFSKKRNASGVCYWADTAVIGSMNRMITAFYAGRSPGVISSVADVESAISIAKAKSTIYGSVYLRHNYQYANIVTFGGSAAKYSFRGAMNARHEFRPYFYASSSGGFWVEDR